MTTLATVLEPGQAKVNVTWAGQTGDLPDPIEFDASEADIRTWVTESVRSGSIPGIRADGAADFSDYVVERFNATADRPWNTVMIRPKTPFGVDELLKLMLRIEPV